MLRLKDIFQKKQVLDLPKYKACNDLPMHYFIDAVCDGDTSRIEDWNEIYSEYCEISKDAQQLLYLNLLKELSVLNNKLVLIEAIVNQLAIKFNDELAAILASYGYPIKDTPHLERDLKMIITRAKGLLIRKNDKLKELENMQSKGSKSTRQDYEEIFATLSKFMQFNLDPMVITVSRYCAIVTQYKNSLPKPKKNGR